MATVSFKREQPEIKCNFSGVKTVQGKDSPCCEGLIQYEPVILDFGEDTEGKVLIFTGYSNSLLVETQFQKIWLLDIQDVILMDGNKLGIKFENLLMY
jgi:hypothetical protein